MISKRHLDPGLLEESVVIVGRPSAARPAHGSSGLCPCLVCPAQNGQHDSVEDSQLWVFRIGGHLFCGGHQS